RASALRTWSFRQLKCFFCRGSRHLLERLANDVVSADPLHPELWFQHQSVAEPGDGDRLDVVRGREVAAVQGGPAAAELEQREGAARAGTDLESRVRSRPRDDVDDVAAEALADVHVLDGQLHRQQRLAVDDRVELDIVLTALEPPLEDRPLVLPAGVADLQA